jgi:hypothetical protein
MDCKAKRLGLGVALIYVSVAGGWILFFNGLVAAFLSPENLAHQTFQGMAWTGLAKYHPQTG